MAYFGSKRLVIRQETSNEGGEALDFTFFMHIRSAKHVRGVRVRFHPRACWQARLRREQLQ